MARKLEKMEEGTTKRYEHSIACSARKHALNAAKHVSGGHPFLFFMCVCVRVHVSVEGNRPRTL
jgi:hypothetical protein